MKNVRRLTALFLVICLCASFALAAVPMEEAHNHDYEAELVQIDSDEIITTEAEAPDRMTWELDSSGTLWIGGTGIIIPIHSAEE